MCHPKLLELRGIMANESVMVKGDRLVHLVSYSNEVYSVQPGLAIAYLIMVPIVKAKIVEEVSGGRTETSYESGRRSRTTREPQVTPLPEMRSRITRQPQPQNPVEIWDVPSVQGSGSTAARGSFGHKGSASPGELAVLGAAALSWTGPRSLSNLSLAEQMAFANVGRTAGTSFAVNVIGEGGNTFALELGRHFPTFKFSGD